MPAPLALPVSGRHRIELAAAEKSAGQLSPQGNWRGRLTGGLQAAMAIRVSCFSATKCASRLSHGWFCLVALYGVMFIRATVFRAVRDLAASAIRAFCSRRIAQLIRYF